mmetsp:Transcript_18504/g.43010  ORF Transcript_18504/g.43010 Transcript_18504/m.43010 type:complete len:374 (+) Transcript_18504:149-1270(+)
MREGVVGQAVARRVAVQPAVPLLGVAVALGVGIEVVSTARHGRADRGWIEPVSTVQLLVRERSHLIHNASLVSEEADVPPGALDLGVVGAHAAHAHSLRKHAPLPVAAIQLRHPNHLGVAPLPSKLEVEAEVEEPRVQPGGRRWPVAPPQKVQDVRHRDLVDVGDHGQVVGVRESQPARHGVALEVLARPGVAIRRQIVDDNVDDLVLEGKEARGVEEVVQRLRLVGVSARRLHYHEPVDGGVEFVEAELEDVKLIEELERIPPPPRPRASHPPGILARVGRFERGEIDVLAHQQPPVQLLRPSSLLLGHVGVEALARLHLPSSRLILPSCSAVSIIYSRGGVIYDLDLPARTLEEQGVVGSEEVDGEEVPLE